VVSAACGSCKGKRLQAAALAVTFAGYDIAELNALSLSELTEVLQPTAALEDARAAWESPESGEQTDVAAAIARDLCARLQVLTQLGLGYLSVDRATPSLSPGEIQRLRIATQLRSGLFGVVYVLDEPSAGLHPADAEPLFVVLDSLKQAGNSLLVVEHNMDLVRRADWIVDVGPSAGERGGSVLYSGPLPGLQRVEQSLTRRYLARGQAATRSRTPRAPRTWLELRNVTRNNLRALDVRLPLGVLTVVTGVSGSGKSTLVSQVLPAVVARALGIRLPAADSGEEQVPDDPAEAVIAHGSEQIARLVIVDQKPIGRTPRSNLATYTGLFDAVRKLFAETPAAKRRGWKAGHFSFNVPEGRCETCQGEGYVSVELLFLPGTYSPCPSCKGTRYAPETLRVLWRERNIAQVLAMTVEEAASFFAEEPAIARSLQTLLDVGVGYLRLGQPAPELSGGEAQRIKLASELQRNTRGHGLYILDEPTTSLHPADIEQLLTQLQRLVDNHNSVIIVEHQLEAIANADWMLDLGPGGGNAGGQVVAEGPPLELASTEKSLTARYLAKYLRES
jgi:excinuclease ABC subunit A